MVDVARGQSDSEAVCAFRRCTDEHHVLAEIELTRVTALKPVARYPAELPPALTCATTSGTR